MKWKPQQRSNTLNLRTNSHSIQLINIHEKIPGNRHAVWTGSTVLLLVSDVCIIHFQTVVSVLFSYEFRNKHSDACIYLPPYKLDVLKIVEYKFSCEMEAHVEVTSLMFDCNTFKDKAFTHFSSYYSGIQRATVLQLYYAVDQPKVGEGHI